MGLKTTPKSSRWILLNKEDVNPFLDDPEFVNKYSNYEEIKKKIPKIIDIENLNKEKKIKKEESEKEFERQVKEQIKSKKIDINKSIILQSVLELEEKYKLSKEYIKKSEIFKRKFRFIVEKSSVLFGDYNGVFNSCLQKEDLTLSSNEKIIFGLTSGIIFTNYSIRLIKFSEYGNDTYVKFSLKKENDYEYVSDIMLDDNLESKENYEYFNHKNNLKFYRSGGQKNFSINILSLDKKYLILGEHLTDFSYWEKNKSTYKLRRGEVYYGGRSITFKGRSITLGFRKLVGKEVDFFNDLIDLVKVKKTVLDKIVNKNESNRKKELSDSIKKTLSEFDKDGNGELDTVQIKDDFEKLVKKHQKKIIEIDRNYIQQFVKISNYQKLKRENLQTIFSSISNSKFQENLDETTELLKERIHSYELILFHSLCMVTCLVEDDMFTFYEIHESFDRLKIFKSDHEREVSEKLTNIEIGIYDLMSSIRSMERNVINELGYLSYVTQSSFHNLSESVTKQLSSIDSSIKFNNLLTGIQTYQTYKINQNTKSLRG